MSLRLGYYRKLQSLSFSWHDRVHSGDLMTRGILDIEGVRLWVDTGILRMILLTVLIGGGAIILIRIDPVLGLIALSFVPIVGMRASIARLKLRDAWLRLQDELSILTKVMEENLGGIRVVRAFAAQAFELARYRPHLRQARSRSPTNGSALFVRNTTPDDVHLLRGHGPGAVGRRLQDHRRARSRWASSPSSWPSCRSCRCRCARSAG